MNKKQAVDIMAGAIVDYLHEGGQATALVGHNRFDVLEFADALEKLGYLASANVVRMEGSRLPLVNTTED